ncbi:uncharacterized protein VTP21DRAFT_9767 [Calcarisporiella thermophila]|uniref:uncharacterized protein n=1 Tax=Calcarisporiella thermophila TaxID=911321 RepID=UPI003743E28B
MYDAFSHHSEVERCAITGLTRAANAVKRSDKWDSENRGRSRLLYVGWHLTRLVVGVTVRQSPQLRPEIREWARWLHTNISRPGQAAIFCLCVNPVFCSRLLSSLLDPLRIAACSASSAQKNPAAMLPRSILILLLALLSLSIVSAQAIEALPEDTAILADESGLEQAQTENSSSVSSSESVAPSGNNNTAIAVISGATDKSCAVSGITGCRPLAENCQFPITAVTVSPPDSEVRFYKDDKCFDLLTTVTGDQNNLADFIAGSIEIFAAI